MATKSKRRSRGRSIAVSIDHVKRNLDRGDFKRALKDARVCHRQSPTPEHRCFLEHAYIGRAQQLMRNGLAEDSRRIIRELLDLGVTEPSVGAGLPELLLAVGMLDCLPQDHDALTDDQRDRLRIKAADQAVVKPESTPKSMLELQDDAYRIRAALQAVEQGDESAALGHLRDIPRQSPFADWKYFVRGLIAYYQHDKTGTMANWDRLDADRTAARIAAPLKVVAGMASPQHDNNLTLCSNISRLEKLTSNRTVLGKLTRLREFAADHDWPQLLKTLRMVRGALRDLDPGVYRRLVSCLCGVFVHDGLVKELDQLSRIVDPPPIDPHWNRAKAIAYGNTDFYDDEDDAEKYWRKYLCDLENLPALSPTQRDLARGMVWLRLAEGCVIDATRFRNCRCGADHGPDIEEAEGRARDAFEQCLTLAPAYSPGYAAAAGFHAAADRPEEAAGVYRRLLEHAPDHLDALLFLAKHHISRGNPLKAREFALCAREQKPLDRETGELLWSTHVGAARELARTEQFDKARDAVAAADRLLPARKDDYDVLARKAVLEIKAGNAGDAQRFVEQAQEVLGEPTALWLAMTVETIRYDLPWQEVCLYEQRWRQSLKRRCRSETASLMCQVLGAQLETSSQPSSRNEAHVRNLLQYVSRCSRVKWRQEDLRRVCEFLEKMAELKLLTKFAKQGMRKFPEVGYFHWLMGMMEMEKGPFKFSRHLTIYRFQQAIKLASKSSDLRDKQIVENAKRCLGLVEAASPDCVHLDDDGDDLDEYSEGCYDNDIDGLSPEEMREIIRTTCERAGLDPEAVLDEIINSKPKK